MLLLQRQNVSLESKTEKLQSHLKTMEARMKELMNTIEQKNKTITERDELRAKIEADYQVKTTTWLMGLVETIGRNRRKNGQNHSRKRKTSS